MKLKSLQLIGIAAGLVPLTAYSQEYSTIQHVTFSLTVTGEEAALLPKDETGKIIRGEPLVWENEFSVESPARTVNVTERGSKMVTERISNKEILEELVEEGVIESIAGYSISVISHEYGDGGSGPIFHLTKKGMAPLNISEYLFILNEGPDVGNESHQRVETIAGDNTTVTESGRSSGKVLAEIGFQMADVSGTVSGVVTWSDMLKPFGSGEDRFYAWIPNPARFNNVAGSILSGDTDEEDLVEGSIAIGPGSLYVPSSVP